MLGRGSMFLMLARWAMTRPIRFKLDSAHPPGCSHHQKIAVIDDRFAVCGGIDMTQDRWDTSAHAEDDPKRLRPNGNPYGPWHDATMIVDGAAARALGELSHDRWKRATGENLPSIDADGDPWPEGLEPMFRDVDIGIARTRADYQGCGEVRENEALFLDLIKSAKRFIYAENQYFTSRKIGEAIARRMEEPDPPEVVIVGPKRADGWLEQKAMDAARIRLGESIGRVDAGNRFRVYYPVTEHGQPIYVHAKVMIVDDRVLRVGSSNMNNRSLGLDSECDLVIDTRLSANAGAEAVIAALRTRLIAEHLGVEQAEVERRFAETGSLCRTIEGLRGKGRTLTLLEFDDPGPAEQFIADNELMDPEDPDGFFEPLTKRGLFRRWRGK
jgi:phosphatidylserine/phosphatidylglycerophosphate/cardiolipin synthase-like enzyme